MTSWVFAALAAAFVLAWSAPAVAVPRFEPSPCGFWVPPHEHATCGYLVVPERRDRPRSRPIRLFVAIFRSFAAQPAPDPIIFLNGGPGDGAFVDDAAEAWWLDSEPYRANRDFIVFDQRGAGRSQPSLDCPEVDIAAETVRAGSVPITQVLAAESAAALACRDRLRQEGVDLAAYRTRESAADVNDLVTTLRLRRYNIFALSYGTRLAFAVMRHHPQRVRSAVLDSVFPPGVFDYADRPWLIARVFQQLFSDCAATPDCRTAFPELGARFVALVERLQAEPVHLSLSTGRAIDVDGARLIHALYTAFSDSAVLPDLPAIISRVIDGDFRRIERWLTELSYADPVNAEGMALSVECSENLPFNDRARLAERMAAYAPYGLAAPFALEWRVCPDWGAPPVPESEHQPVRSAIPALLLTGTYDPVTPPEWTYRAAANLSQATVLEFATGGHVLTLNDPCAELAAVTFFADPAADVASLCPDRSTLPRFHQEDLGSPWAEH